MRGIPLTKGYFALVDDEDYDRLAQHKWCASTVGSHIYAVRHPEMVGGRRGSAILMHREVMNAAKGEKIGHFEGVGLDNQKDNLRRATTQQIGARRVLGKDSTSGRKGVYTRNGKFVTTIKFDGKTIHLGTSDELEVAAAKYLEAAEELFGEFAKA